MLSVELPLRPPPLPPLPIVELPIVPGRIIRKGQSSVGISIYLVKLMEDSQAPTGDGADGHNSWFYGWNDMKSSIIVREMVRVGRRFTCASLRCI